MDISRQYQALTKYFKSPWPEYRMGCVPNTGSKVDRTYAAKERVDGTQAALQLLLAGLLTYPQHICEPFDICDLQEVTLNVNGDKHSADDVQKLLRYARISPYGDLKSGKTVVNEKIRKCQEIQYGVTCKISNITMKDKIHHTLFPAHKQISVTFNKIVIYGPGGHFSRHVDTPAPGVIGTLVLVPETKHVGGSLVLETRDGIVEVGAGTWCAFYGSLPHCVKEVTEGHRIALTFYIVDGEHTDDVFEQGEMPAANPKVPVIEAEPSICKTLLASLPFGIILKERYAISELTPKGADVDIISKLRETLGKEITLIHALRSFTEIYSCEGEYTGMHRGEAEDDVCDEIYEFSPRVLADINADIRGAEHKAPFRDINFYLLGDDGETTYSDGQPFIEYTGNEAQEGLENNIYICMAAIIS